MVMFGVPILFMVLGLLEMALREKGGIPRPDNFRFKPGQDLAPEASHFKR
jgi:hypothetical protein